MPAEATSELDRWLAIGLVSRSTAAAISTLTDSDVDDEAFVVDYESDNDGSMELALLNSKAIDVGKSLGLENVVKNQMAL